MLKSCTKSGLLQPIEECSPEMYDRRSLVWKVSDISDAVACEQNVNFITDLKPAVSQNIEEVTKMLLEQIEL